MPAKSPSSSRMNVALTRALSRDPARLAKVQKAIDSERLEALDAELQALLK